MLVGETLNRMQKVVMKLAAQMETSHLNYLLSLHLRLTLGKNKASHEKNVGKITACSLPTGVLYCIINSQLTENMY